MGELRHLMEARFRRLLKTGAIVFHASTDGGATKVKGILSAQEPPNQNIVISSEGISAYFYLHGGPTLSSFWWAEIYDARPFGPHKEMPPEKPKRRKDLSLEIRRPLR